MQIKIKRLDKSVPLPQYQTAGSVGFDFCSRETMEIKPKEIALVPTGLIIATPPGYMLALFSRSSTPRRKGLMIPNSVGIVDQDFCGPEDEIKIFLYNFTEQTVIVEKGERIAQGVFVRIDTGEWDETDEMNSPSRGGFGSTGK
ncbi:MAG: dUTP diphosphatase [Patescibacteria group bacterium]